MALSFKCCTPIGIILLNLLVTASGQSNYFTVGEKSYRAFTTQKVNWYRAYQICTTLGMQLASIESESDFTALKQQLFSNSLLSNNYWLAGNNLSDRGDYVWLSSGKKISYTKWAASQPGNAANRCVRTDSNFEWNSDACTNANYFICSKPVLPDCGVYGTCNENLYYFF